MLMTALSPVLSRLGLAQYLEVFLEEGFDTWETVLDITESDLDSLNVKLGHRRRLQREIASVRGISIEQLVPSPILGTLADESHHAEDEETVPNNNSRYKTVTGSTGKRKYRRHPRPDENAPERPPSAYVIFSNKIREELKPQNLSFTDIAKRVGERWQILAMEEKDAFESEASYAKEKYNAEMARYKRTANYREYALYITDFKLKNGVPNATPSRESKRQRMNTEASNASSESNGKADGAPSSTSARTSPMIEYPGTTASGINLHGRPSSPPSLSTSPSSQRYVSESPTVRPTIPFLPGPESISRREDHTVIPPKLPRIVTLEGRDAMVPPGILPPIMPEPSLFGNNITARRSAHSPATFARNDTSRSSASSHSRDLSSNGTTPASVYTPISPNDEGRSQRSLPLPASLSSSTGLDSKTSPYSSYSSAMPVPQNQYSPVLPADLPTERHSLMKLSLENPASPTSPPSRLQPVIANSRPGLTHEQSPATPMPGNADATRREKRPTSYSDLRMDPLSVLAMAGRMVDAGEGRPP